jgi:Leucine-rich repeat (LRR) protein
MRKLSRQDIVDITGVAALDTLLELEILFTTCNEIDSLEECCNLKRLAMIDNGLQSISNLRPVGNTLISLCLCDQAISVMANLDLPNLQELFLHRNVITKITGLNGCPRLKRLWLSQNSITELGGLHAVPELEECFVQANEISRISGLDTNTQLRFLGLAGNGITDYEELAKLARVPNLQSLSLVDIHFGRCPVTEDGSYKDFVATYLPQVRVLDGVSISREQQHTAETAYSTQVSFSGPL